MNQELPIALKQIGYAVRMMHHPAGALGPGAAPAMAIFMLSVCGGAAFNQLVLGVVAGTAIAIFLMKARKVTTWMDVVCLALAEYQARDVDDYQALLARIESGEMTSRHLSDWLDGEIMLWRVGLRVRSSAERALLDSRFQQEKGPEESSAT